jgi:hypothetical protein
MEYDVRWKQRFENVGRALAIRDRYLPAMNELQARLSAKGAS